MKMQLGQYQSTIESRLQKWEAENVHGRIWQLDGTVWIPDPALAAKTNELTNRLGWLTVGEEMVGQVDNLTTFAKEMKAAGFQDVVLLGMGGSSLAPEVFMTVFGAANGIPLRVLDSTNPEQVLAVTKKLADVTKALFIVSSKSGGTLETFSFYKYFYDLVGQQKANPGENFIAITDPGSGLEKMAIEKKFRRIFLSLPTVGGRYSALTYFGLAPAALVGVDVGKLLRHANNMAEACRQPAIQNPGLQLGAALGELAAMGRDKVTIFASPKLDSVGMWVEQLVAESTGKQGKGILPVVGEAIALPSIYGNDRVFVYLRLAGDDNAKHDGMVQALELAGQPVIYFELNELEELGSQFFLWEMATAASCAVLVINPYDQPNVELAKIKARRLMVEFQEKGSLPLPTPTLKFDDVEIYGAATGGNGIEAMQNFMAQAKPDDYVAIMAYLPYSVAVDEAMNELRLWARDKFHLATTVGYGPRFLHSTGQLHKGDGNKGLFIQFTHQPANDAPIAGEKYTFATVVAAQAQGDNDALSENQRRLMRFHLKQSDLAGAIRQLIPA